MKENCHKWNIIGPNIHGIDYKMSSKIPTKVSNEVASAVNELYQKYICNYCLENIPGLRIKCADCPDFDLCLPCFACGAQIGKHKNWHKYLFMNNGGFAIFPSGHPEHNDRNKRSSAFYHRGYHSICHGTDNTNLPTVEETEWNAREEMRLLDAVEMYGYGNWKDIAAHIEKKTPETTKEEYIKHYIHGIVGKHTWKEELRGYATDHTQASDLGPLSPTLTGKLPPIAVSRHEALLLGYMPHRDDFEDFDKVTENLVSQIADRSAEDDDLDVALKLSQCDIYERRLREQVRSKRVARDYQLVSKFYEKNPIVQIGFGSKVSPQKISNQLKAKKRGDGPKAELMEALRGVTQFHTSQEFHQFINNICVEKELKVRIKELFKYRENGITRQSELISFEKGRFKREMKLRQRRKKSASSQAPNPRFLPSLGDYSLKAILDPAYDDVKYGMGPNANITNGTSARGGPGGLGKKKKRAKWARKKLKTGRRLLIQQGAILTVADPKGSRRESTDSNLSTN